jgi:hypothetical protein
MSSRMIKNQLHPLRPPPQSTWDNLNRICILHVRLICTFALCVVSGSTVTNSFNRDRNAGETGRVNTLMPTLNYNQGVLSCWCL